jgi:DNA-binding XRE family transcriptional regulator
MPPPLPLVLSPGEWRIVTRILAGIAAVARANPGTQIRIIGGNRTIAILDRATVAALCTAEDQIARTSPGAKGRNVPPRVTIGEQIRTRRRAAGYTQKSLAERLGWTTNRFAAAERGEIDLSEPDLDQVALTLDVTRAHLTGPAGMA